MKDNILGKRLREARGNLSLREFAAKCGISHTHLDSIEKGVDPRTKKEVSVGWETLKKLSVATDLSINYLVGDTDDKADGLVFGLHGLQSETTLSDSKIPNPRSQLDNYVLVDASDAIKATLVTILGRNPNESELAKFKEFAELFVKGLDKVGE